MCSVDLRTVTRLAAKLPKRPLVVSLNPASLQDVLDSLSEIGKAVGLEAAAAEARADLDRRIAASTREVANDAARPNVLFMEWPEPIFVGGHWTPQLIHNAGGVQRIHPLVGKKSFAVKDEDVARDDADVIVAAGCGLNLETVQRVLVDVEAHPVRGPWWRSLRAVREGRVYLADGSLMFNRPSHHLVAAQEWMSWVLDAPLEVRAADRRDTADPRCAEFPWRPYVGS